MKYNLNPGYQFIQLNQLLKLLSIAETGGIANQMITNGEVLVNGNVEIQKRKKLFPGDKISIGDQVLEIVSEEDD